MRRIGAVLAVMIGLGIGLAVWAGPPAPAQTTEAARIASLETRVADLETAVSASEPTATAFPTSTPAPTPYVQQGDTFTLSGTDTGGQELQIRRGTYDVAFRCEDPAGKAHLWFPIIGGDIFIAAGATERVTFPTEELTIALLFVTCDGAWRITGTP